jgi:hypothetical protein
MMSGGEESAAELRARGAIEIIEEEVAIRDRSESAAPVERPWKAR